MAGVDPFYFLVGPGLNPQYTRAHFGGEAVGCSPAAHKCHDSMSATDEKGRTLRHHGSGASFRSTEQHKVIQVSQEQEVSDSQPADGVFCTACSTEGEADWTNRVQGRARGGYLAV